MLGDGGKGPDEVEESGGKAMVTQRTILGHLEKVKGMGDDGLQPLVPEERREDAEETPRRRREGGGGG